jgi:hypothetical protein
MTPYFSGAEDASRETALLYGGLAIVAAVVHHLAYTIAFYTCDVTIARIRTACSGIIYRQVRCILEFTCNIISFAAIYILPT